MKLGPLAAALAATVALPVVAHATDLEVTHWWTSGGEAAAVAEFAKAFDATGNTWVDAAIAGSGGTARPIMISRITGGDPMGATQFNHGRQAEELVEAGLMRDLTDVATAEHWADVVAAPQLLEGCTLDGKIYCVPVNIHSWQWLWLIEQGVRGRRRPGARPTGTSSSPRRPSCARPARSRWRSAARPGRRPGVFNVLMVALGGKDVFIKVYGDKDAEVAAGPEVAKVFQAVDDAREMAKGSNVQDWNQATNLVITDKAGGQIMGDWAQGEFQVAGEVAGKDYTCLPGLGVNEIIDTAGDAFYFPLLDDEEKSKAQEVLASVMISPETQVAFNLKKGSLPIRLDVDLNAANDCMKKGIEILKAGNTVPATTQLNSEDTNTQINDLFVEFFSDDSITPEDAQARFVEIIKNAD